MDKNTNNLLFFGIVILVAGLLLLAYSVSSYMETKALSDKIDFSELENNNQMPDSEKYFQYLSNADFLNQKINQNKNIPFKNASCIYLDFAQHNAVSMFKLTKTQTDPTRNEVAQGNIRTLLTNIDSYRSCKNYANYKTELEKILDTDTKTEDFFEQDRMNNFINGDYADKEPVNIPLDVQEEQTDEYIPYIQPNTSDTMQTGGTY